MKNKTRLIIGSIVIGLFVSAAATGAWLWEKNRAVRYETLAEQAAEIGDMEQAESYAAQLEPEKAEKLLQDIAYRNAEQAFQSGCYAEAEAAFLALGTYGDAQTRVRECRYALAVELERTGDDEAARDAFFALVPYEDAEERYYACCYRIASQILADGDGYQAFQAFCELIPYADAEELAIGIAMELTGESDPQKAVALAKGLSEDDWQRIVQLENARETLITGRIDTGHAYAVLLSENGNAQAVGDSTYGQCDVSAFTDLTAVAAGYRHTVGLKSDGTVVAAGDNMYGQCDVSGWTDAVSIACGPWDTFAIRTDGTLLHCGFSDYDLTGWEDLLSVSACETALIGVRRDGMLLSTRAEDRFQGNSFVDAVITMDAAFALRDDGTVCATDERVSVWTNVVLLEGSSTVLVGLCADGTLLAHAMLPENEMFAAALSRQTNVSEIAVSGTFALIRHTDGTLSACGDVPEQIAEFVRNTPGN